jgi:helicase
MYLKPSNNHPAIDIALDTIKIQKQALVFTDTKPSAEKTAEDIAKKNKPEQKELVQQILKAIPSPTKQCYRLAFCVERGIAFHHAGLITKQRQTIETAFREGKIKIICATPTLAQGLDLPAFRVIMKSLKRFSGNWGADWIPTLEYQQMAGRAGRPKFHDTHGEAVSIARTDAEQDEIYERFVSGKPEPIYSKLAVEPVLRTHVLSLIATGFVRNKQQLTNFFEKTFWAHQYTDMEKLENILDKTLSLLEKWNFIQTKQDDFIKANELNKETPFTATLLGRRVAELYLDPLTANQLIKGLKRTNYPTTFALLQLFSHTLEMRPLLRTRSKEYDAIQSKLLEHYEELLEMEPSTYDPEHDEFMNSIKTAFFFEQWISETTEEQLLEQHKIRPGEIRSKLAIADWLLYSLEQIAPLLKAHSAAKELRKLRTRVKYGVKEELLTLLRLEGIGRIRARKLYRAGFKDIAKLKKADISELSHILGKKTAESVKKQLGQEIKKASPRKRKGQIGLEKF